MLDRSSKKFVCPACNKKRFVRYVDRETGNYLDGDYGRCDRSDNCGYFKSPKQDDIYFGIKFLSLVDYNSKAYRLTDENCNIHFVPKSMVLETEGREVWIKEYFLKNSDLDYSAAQSKAVNKEGGFVSLTDFEPIPEPEPSFLQREEVDEVLNAGVDCNLTKYLKTEFDSELVDRAFKRYGSGATNLFWNNSTCFLQMDRGQNIRAGKIMLYSENNGRRVKEPYPQINWLHNKIEKGGGFNLNQCLFGLHLLENKPVAIVESEKTAIVMSILSNKTTWMACGSKTAINEKMLEPLKSNKVVLFPDKGSAGEWQQRADELSSKGFNIQVSRFLENKVELENGKDIADLYLM
ncbi:DUF6371 domain-containing protein [Flagellimonas lutimaris]|uniref:DUF6371 domain-containing protein n=1 Tax=Flagellimonas lutimaris TaxID=475082 RepID=UPI001FE5FA10|nr:DUF6371 domain-containing protein [Allomuricauda lutimaris]